MASFMAGGVAAAGAAGPASSSIASGRKRGKTLYPNARPFLMDLRKICMYGTQGRAGDENTLREKHFDDGCLEYFSSLLDGTEKNGAGE